MTSVPRASPASIPHTLGKNVVGGSYCCALLSVHLLRCGIKRPHNVEESAEQMTNGQFGARCSKFEVYCDCCFADEWPRTRRLVEFCVSGRRFNAFSVVSGQSLQRDNGWQGQNAKIKVQHMMKKSPRVQQGEERPTCNVQLRVRRVWQAQPPNLISTICPVLQV